MGFFSVIASPVGAKQSLLMGLLRHFVPRNDKFTPPLFHVTQSADSLISVCLFLTRKKNTVKDHKTPKRTTNNVTTPIITASEEGESCGTKQTEHP